ncbi:MAG: IMP dehydrogenase [Deltaproteobacteria bacterium]|nr:IMP dehydrogenase [Deltaproteobacteria bacterium]
MSLPSAKLVEETGLSFDDILIIPKSSEIETRADVDLSVQLGNIRLSLPIVSAPMDAVTGHRMAQAMAECGGLGIIHRFASIDEQISEVKKVKRARNVVILKPVVANEKHTLHEIKNLEEQYGIHSFPVVNNEGKLVGLLTRSDYILEENLTTKVADLMTPASQVKMLELKSMDSFDINLARSIIKESKIKILPIVDSTGALLGLVTRRDIIELSNTKATVDAKGRLCVGAAVGIRHDWLERAGQLADAEVDAICIDVANGYLKRVAECVRILKHKYEHLTIIAGNVATQEGVLALLEAGVDVVKVGIGPGSVCTTRVVTGVGVPQATAIYWSASVKGDKKIIADGGCRTSGDIAKALALGGDSVMLGSMLAGTDESPGDVLVVNNRRVKSFRGMASAFAFRDKKEKLKDSVEFEPTPEGVSIGFSDYKGSVKEVLVSIEKALRSAFSYVGAHNLDEFHKRSQFIKITQSAIKESHPHSVTVIG